MSSCNRYWYWVHFHNGKSCKAVLALVYKSQGLWTTTDLHNEKSPGFIYCWYVKNRLL